MNAAFKRFLSGTLVIFAVISVLLSGCGSGSSSPSYNYSSGASSTPAPQAAPDFSREYFSMDSAAGERGMVETESQREFTNIALEDRKVVRHNNLSLETMEFDEVYSRIPELVKAAGGYVDNQSMDGRSMRYSGDYYERNAAINARVPSAKLDEVAAAVGELGNVVSQSENMDDITDTYFDTEARLKSLQLQEERLLAVLAEADNLTDIITLERALSDVRYQIESLQASLLRMDKQVAYSYLNISLREVVDYTIPVTKPKTFGERLGESFSRAYNNLTTTFEVLLFGLIENLPVLLILGIFILLIFLVVRTIIRVVDKRRPKKPAPPPQQYWAPGQPGPYGPAGQRFQPPAAPPSIPQADNTPGRGGKDPQDKK